MSLTDDPNDPNLTHGADAEPVMQAPVYLILSEEERAKGFVRPLRLCYIHAEALGGCGATTCMASPIAETYARNPSFYGGTYCVGCGMHRPVGENGEFVWADDNEKVGT